MHCNIKKNKELICLLVMTALWGGFYEFSSAVYVVLFLCLLGGVYQEKKRIEVPPNKTTYCMLGIGVSYLLSVFIANDKGMAALGLIKIIAGLLFYLLWCNEEVSKREQWISKIPEVGAILTGVALAGYFIPPLHEWFYRSGRLGGTFQYSNTYALFLLIGIIILIYQKSWKRKTIIEGSLLIIGIVFSGSRSVFVLAIGVVVLCLIRGKINKKASLAISASFIIAVLAGMLIYQVNIGRLWELTLESSTLNGRLLYAKDAIPVVIKHPLGLGYMGYYYLQPQFQTGDYVTRFVHNEFLQYGLDAGWIAMAALLGIFFIHIFSKGNVLRNKMILGVLLLHCFFDFDLQYPVMTCILIMSFGNEENSTQNKLKDNLWILRKRVYKAVGVVLFGLSIYVFCISIFSYIGKYEMAGKLYPWYTDAEVACLQKDANIEAVENILGQNDMLATVYETKANLSIEAGNYAQVKKDVQEMLRCAGYNMYYYNQAVYFDSYALDLALRKNDEESAQGILDDIQTIPKRLVYLKKNTSGLAYRTVDAPDFKLDESVQTYLDSVENINVER